MNSEKRIEDEVRDIIRYRYGSVANFAKSIGIPATTIYNILEKGFDGSGINIVFPICEALGLDPAALVKKRIRRAEGDPEFIDVPIVSTVSAGLTLDQQPLDGTHPVPIVMNKRYPNAFLAKVNGTSMDRVLPDGTYALIDPDSTVSTGDIAMVNINGEDAIIKRVELLNSGIRLKPDSTDPTHKVYEYECADEDCTNIVLVGKAIWYTPPFDFLIPFKWDE